jgi:hypothetical protein
MFKVIEMESFPWTQSLFQMNLTVGMNLSIVVFGVNVTV